MLSLPLCKDSWVFSFSVADVCYVTSLYSDARVETSAFLSTQCARNTGDDPTSGHLREAVHVLFLLGENRGSDVPSEERASLL